MGIIEEYVLGIAGFLVCCPLSASLKFIKEHNVSETESVSFFRRMS
jgi:hypothetical protein